MRVLLVDHDSEGLEAIARAIRGVLELDCVTSKGDAMLLLRQNTYDVLIACERCVDGSGLDLLGRTTRAAAPLKRIFAAPGDRLQLLGPRLAPFKVQRTINYPIDLEELWLAIAQVTGTNDETDGTIERVVLDERGIPANGSTPRAPIPPRPPAPLREVRPPAPAVAAAAANGRAAVARVAQPVPELPLRAPPPPRQPPPMRVAAPPASTSDTGRMRAPRPPASPADTGRMRAPAPPASTSDTGRMRAPLAASDTGRMRAIVPPPPVVEEPSWIPEPAEDDFASLAAQARMGMERKVVDEAARRKKQRLLTAGGIAAVVAAALVFLIEKFYDPEARAREQAIAAEVSRMAEQQKVTENLMLIEVEVEQAITENDLDAAREALARLVAQAPEHPRLDFLQKSIDRAAELARLTAQNPSGAAAADSGRAAAGSASTERAERNASSRPSERATNRPERLAARATDRAPATEASKPAARSFGAPIGESVQRTIPLNAPINSEPTLTQRRADNSFGGRTVEASDSAVGRSATPVAAANPIGGGSAEAIPPPAPVATPVIAPASVAPAPVSLNVTPAKIVKRVQPVAPVGVPARTGGFVVVKFNITENGRVADVEVVESSPAGVFDGAAQSAVRKWMYEPRKEDGVAVASTAKARLVFEPAN
jgi:TonB family protein